MKRYSWLSRPGDANGRALRLSPPPRGDRRRKARPLLAYLLGCSTIAVLVIAASTAVSGANFIRTSSNPGNLFAGGTFRLLNSVDGGYVVNVANLRPGQSVSGTLTLTCQGDFTSTATMANGGITNTPTSPALSGALTLLIEDITGTPQTHYNGTMSAFTSVNLNQFSPGQTRTYRFTVSFPQSGAVPQLQGATSSMQINIVGVAQ